MKNRTMLFGLFLLSVSALSLCFGQGVIKGVVADSTERQPLIGANVSVVGTAFGAATDRDGAFSIPRIPEGRYMVKVSYIGYKTRVLPVDVRAGVSVELRVSLGMDVIEGETVVVTAQAMGQAGAINRQLSSTTITNVVAADKIMELPDANAAEAVGRLPGVSVVRSGGEGNKVVIRGLSPTYNAITIGGDRIPSTDLDDRSVDLSMIAPEVLSGIEVTKALTPDKDADALGGTVDFQIATAPRGGFKGDFRLQTGYNQERDEYGEYKGRFAISNRYVDESFGIFVTGNFEKTQRGSDKFLASYAVAREKRPGEEFAPITTLSATFEYTTDVRERQGFGLMFDYVIPGGKLVANNLFSRLDRSELVRTRRFDMSGSNKMKYYLRDRERLIDILTNSIAGEHDLSILKLNWRLSRNASATRHTYNSRFQFEEANAFDTGNVPAIASPGQIIANAYNRVELAYLYDGEFEPEESYERDLTGQLNVEWPYAIVSELVGTLKGGVKFREKFRERDRNYATKRLDITDPNFARYHTKYGTPGFVYERAPGTGYAYMKNYFDPQFSAGTFMDGTYDFGVGLDARELDHFLNAYLFDNVYNFSLQRDLDDYSVTDMLSAGYLMTELHLGSFLMLVPGVRYEHTRINTNGRTGIIASPEDEGLLDDERVRDTTSVITYEKWFPMVHLRIKPTEWCDLRLAYTWSVSYPRMDYMIPTKKIKASELLVDVGNPGLKAQMSTNYDAYLSFYGNQIGLFTVGGFYKVIDDLIYLRSGHIILDPEKEGVDKNYVGYSISRPENNPNQTTVKGLEVEWQANLKWLPRPFDGIVISANYSRIWSQTDFPRSYVREERIPVFPFRLTTVVDTFRTGNMPDQATNIGNFSVGYDLGGFSGRVSMLLQGKTLTYVGVREELDGFTNTFARWDASLKYNITDYFGIYLNLYNFTNQPDESYMQTARYATAREYYGWTADVGISIKL